MIRRTKNQFAVDSRKSRDGNDFSKLRTYGNSLSNPKRRSNWRMVRTGLLAALTLAMFAIKSQSASNDKDALARAIGHVMLAADGYRLEGKEPEPLEMLKTVEAEYESLKVEPAEVRLRFFWTIMHHANLDGMYLHDFLTLASADCKDLLVAKLQAYKSAAAKDGSDSKVKWVNKYLTIRGHEGGKCAASVESRTKKVHVQNEWRELMNHV